MFHKLKQSFLRFKRYVKWLYMLYELNTYLAICEPWEKVFINCLFAVCLGLIFYSTFVFIPSYVVIFVHYITPSASPEALIIDPVLAVNDGVL